MDLLFFSVRSKFRKIKLENGVKADTLLNEIVDEISSVVLFLFYTYVIRPHVTQGLGVHFNIHVCFIVKPLKGKSNKRKISTKGKQHKKDISITLCKAENKHINPKQLKNKPKQKRKCRKVANIRIPHDFQQKLSKTTFDRYHARGDNLQGKQPMDGDYYSGNSSNDMNMVNLS